MVIKAKEANIKKLIIAKENVEEAKVVKGLEIFGCGTLREALDLLDGKIIPLNPTNISPFLPRLTKN